MINCEKCHKCLPKNRKRFCSNSCKVSILNSERDQFGSNNSFFGHTHSEETKRKIGNISREWQLKHLHEKKYVKSSKSETKFLDLVENHLRIKFNRQFFLDGRFFDAKYNNLLIEIDSNYWHRNREKIDNEKNVIAAKNKFFLLRVEVNCLDQVEDQFYEHIGLLEFIL